MKAFLTNFDDTEKSVPVEPEYSSIGEFWDGQEYTQAPRTDVPRPKGEKRLNDSVDPEGD